MFKKIARLSGDSFSVHACISIITLLLYIILAIRKGTPNINSGLKIVASSFGFTSAWAIGFITIFPGQRNFGDFNQHRHVIVTGCVALGWLTGATIITEFKLLF